MLRCLLCADWLAVPCRLTLFMILNEGVNGVLQFLIRGCLVAEPLPKELIENLGKRTAFRGRNRAGWKQNVGIQGDRDILPMLIRVGFGSGHAFLYV